MSEVEKGVQYRERFPFPKPNTHISQLISQSALHAAQKRIGGGCFWTHYTSLSLSYLLCFCSHTLTLLFSLVRAFCTLFNDLIKTQIAAPLHVFQLSFKPTFSTSLTSSHHPSSIFNNPSIYFKNIYIYKKRPYSLFSFCSLLLSSSSLSHRW